MNKFTPRPWVVSKYGMHGDSFVVSHSSEKEDDERVVSDDICRLSGSNKEANARLISAAPELLEACKAVITEERKQIAIKDGGIFLHGPLSIKLQEAIARAEGKEEGNGNNKR